MDLPEVVDIARPSPGDNEPWSEDVLLSLLRADGVVGIVAVDAADPEHPVVGYCIYQYVSPEIIVHLIAVKVEYRRRGIGRLLLDEVRDKLPRMKCDRIATSVSDCATEVHLFLRSAGLRAVEVDGDYYLFESLPIDDSSLPLADELESQT